MASTQTPVPTRKVTSTAGRPHHPLWRALAITIAVLWLYFLTNLGLSIAQQIGQALGAPLVSLAPQLLAWARQQPLLVQVCLALLVVYLTAAIVVLTVWLWQLKTKAQLEEEQAALAAQTAVYSEATRERDEALAAEVATGRAEAATSAQDAHDLAERNLAVAEVTLGDVRQIEQQIRRDDLPLVPVKAFTLSTMGDDSAANFPYVRAPFERQLEHAKAVLAACARGESAKHGLIVTGESNAGKTRFALQALRECELLAGWDVLEWNEAYREDRIPATERVAERNLIIFLDDLQNYVPETPRAASIGGQTLAAAALASPAASTLRALYQRLRPNPSQQQQQRHVIVVATCRSERLSAARDNLDWLFTQAECIDIPAFNPDESSSEARAIFAAFRAFATQGRIDTSSWDGTLGSLLLGLDDKRAEYERRLTPNAVVILRAMKLLSLAGVPGHTGRRVRAICADEHLFGVPELATSTAVWDAALADLRSYQFVTILPDEDDVLLRIRKDPAYFTDVITDYPRQDQREPHRRRLREVFAAIEDADALFYLGNSWYEDQHYDEAVAAYQKALEYEPTAASAWYNLGLTLARQQHYDEAVAAYQKALEYEPTNASAWNNLGTTLDTQQHYDEAVAAFHQALEYEPTLAIAWNNQAYVYKALGDYRQAHESIDRAIALEPDDGDWWDSKGDMYAAEGRYQDALDAYEHALQLNPTLVISWRNKANTLRLLGRTADANAADARANKLEAHPPSATTP